MNNYRSDHFIGPGVGVLRRLDNALRNERNGSNSMVYEECLVGPLDSLC